jgi:hypothetical protein
VKTLNLLVQLFICLHHRLYLHLRLQFHALYRYLQLGLSLLAFGYALIIGFGLAIEL